MNPDKLAGKLTEQINYYSHWAFEQACSFDELDTQQFGRLNDPETFYQVKIWTIQKQDDFVDVAVSVDDGRTGRLGAMKAISGTITFYRDGRVSVADRVESGD